MADKVRRAAKRVPGFARVVRIARPLVNTESLPELDASLDRVLSPLDQITLVQIGSNDGLHGDPFHDLIASHPQWRVLFVEPVPEPLHRLRATWGDGARFMYADVAVSSRAGSQQMTYLSEEVKALGQWIPDWVDQLASFTPGHVERHLPAIAAMNPQTMEPSELEPYIRTLTVRSVTVDQLLDEHAVVSVDVLHIDTEGHDWVILQQVDLARVTPSVILYEHKHLSEEDRLAAQDFLTSRYEITQLSQGDTLCLRR